jgi:molybdopterin-guanine dinucleotide biosynthesis protein A
MGADKAKFRLGRHTLLEQVRRSAGRLKLPVRVLRKDAIPRCGPLGGVYTAFLRSRAGAILFLSCDMPFMSHELLAKVARALPKRGLAAFAMAASSPLTERDERGSPSACYLHAKSLGQSATLPTTRPGLEEERPRSRAPVKPSFSKIEEGGLVSFPFVLRREAAPVIRQLLASGGRSLQHAAAVLNARRVRIPKQFQPELFNINTPGDWKKARQLWKERHSHSTPSVVSPK